MNQENPLTLPDYFSETILVAAMSKELRNNASNLLTRVNRLMRQFGQNRCVVKGFAPTRYDPANPNDSLFCAPAWDISFIPDKHNNAEAIDLADPEGDLDQWLLDNQKLLEACGLWIEHPATTRGHCHLQSVPPKGGARRRVFYP